MFSSSLPHAQASVSGYARIALLIHANYKTKYMKVYCKANNQEKTMNTCTCRMLQIAQSDF